MKRPTDRRLDQIRAIRDLRRLGWPRDRICSALGLPRSTYYWLVKNLDRIDRETRGMGAVA